jgi:hypothetical protein
MLISDQNPSGDLTIFIKRAKINKDKELSIIPDPVFEPNYEKNIDRQTCISYQVNEGHYIQVISPAGRTVGKTLLHLILENLIKVLKKALIANSFSLWVILFQVQKGPIL